MDVADGNHCETDSDSDEEPFVAPDHLVQIHSTGSEMRKMIDCFLAGRRLKLNKKNILEFCGPSYGGDSCARVSAVYFNKQGLVQVEDAEKYWSKWTKKL